jgi:hypothetical protein
MAALARNRGHRLAAYRQCSADVEVEGAGSLQGGSVAAIVAAQRGRLPVCQQ